MEENKDEKLQIQMKDLSCMIIDIVSNNAEVVKYILDNAHRCKKCDEYKFDDGILICNKCGGRICRECNGEKIVEKEKDEETLKCEDIYKIKRIDECSSCTPEVLELDTDKGEKTYVL